MHVSVYVCVGVHVYVRALCVYVCVWCVQYVSTLPNGLVFLSSIILPMALSNIALVILQEWKNIQPDHANWVPVDAPCKSDVVIRRLYY